MKNSLVFLIIGLFISVSAATGQVVKHDLNQTEIDKIISEAATNEANFRQALADYVFNRSAAISTIGLGGQVTGVYRRDSFMTFSQEGRRFERVTYSPVSTLVDLRITPEDIEDLGGVNPFAIEPRLVSQYNFTFLGKEKIDDLNLYVFDIAPKVMPNPKKTDQRMFLGRVWIDDRDLMIVKSKGKGVPETKDNKFPVIETWRENVDGKYWFPSFMSSDDQLVFDSGQVVKLKVRVKFEDYKLGRTDVKIVGEEDMVEDVPEPTPPPKKP